MKKKLLLVSIIIVTLFGPVWAMNKKQSKKRKIDTSTTANFDEIPREVFVFEIISYLPTKELFKRLMLVNKDMYEYCLENIKRSRHVKFDGKKQYLKEDGSPNEEFLKLTKKIKAIGLSFFGRSLKKFAIHKFKNTSEEININTLYIAHCTYVPEEIFATKNPTIKSLKFIESSIQDSRDNKEITFEKLTNLEELYLRNSCKDISRKQLESIHTEIKKLTLVNNMDKQFAKNIKGFDLFERFKKLKKFALKNRWYNDRRYYLPHTTFEGSKSIRKLSFTNVHLDPNTSFKKFTTLTVVTIIYKEDADYDDDHNFKKPDQFYPLLPAKVLETIDNLEVLKCVGADLETLLPENFGKLKKVILYYCINIPEEQLKNKNINII
jgi:hypothetical protein